MDKNKALVPALLISFIVILMAGSIYIYSTFKDNGGTVEPVTDISADPKLQKFTSEAEFKEYIDSLTTTSSDNSGGFGMGGVAIDGLIDKEVTSPMPDAPTDSASGSGGEMPVRYSDTNVQVLSIDEPDIVKTDGKFIYVSEENSYGYYRGGMVDDGIAAPEPSSVMDVIENVVTPSSAPDGVSIDVAPDYIYPQYEAVTNFINASDLSDLKVSDTIKDAGKMLLIEDNLIILNGEKIIAYDTTQKDGKLEKSWSYKLGENTSIFDARKYKDKLYVIATQPVYDGGKCIMPLLLEESNTSTQTIRCMDIYYPNEYSPYGYQSTYTLLKLDADGNVEAKTTYLADINNTVVYMSENAIYLTYARQTSPFTLEYDFIMKYPQLFNERVINEVKQLNEYNLRSNSKQYELEQILSDYTLSLTPEDRTNYQNDLQESFSQYITQNIREINSTGIIKFSTIDLAVLKTGSVPGTLLNQFSLDEYKGNLRVVTTLQGSYWGAGLYAESEDQNDLYVLNSNLVKRSAIQGLGLDESVYSVRFVGERAYVVTFKQIDPFFVFDLNNPDKPVLKGELKIPGYSSYLHPLSDNLILGIGQENWKVKISLFDVSNPSNPIEKDNYILANEYWTEISNTHHAFLNDPSHDVFFLPASSGYIFGYEDEKIELKKVVTASNVKRALYIDDYMYIVSDDEIITLDENNWQPVNSLDL